MRDHLSYVYACMFSQGKKMVLFPLMLLLLTGALGYVLSILIASFATNKIVMSPPLDAIHCANNDSFPCWRKRMETVTTILGPVAAMNDLRSLYATRRGLIIAECHQLAHAVGNTAFERFGDVAEAFVSGDPFCWSGYYHGILEQAIPDVGRDHFLSNADKVCSKIPGKERYSFDYYNCVHGLGHGLMAMDQNELFVALDDCNALSGEWEQRSCYGGVFMENIMNGHKRLNAFLKPDDLLYPCNVVKERYKEECYKMQTSYMLAANGGSFRNAFELCALADINYRATCAQSAGRDASGRSASNIAMTIKSCGEALNDAQQQDCYTGAVKDFISYFHSDTQAKALCASVEERFRADCFSVAADYVRVL